MVVFTDRFGTQVCITAVNEFLASKLSKYLFFQWFEGCLFVCISCKGRKSKGDAVAIHKQTHLNDRIWSVFFAFSILFVSIFLLDFKVVEFNGKLKEIAKKIPGNFIQIHQSYLINFDYIEECSYESVKMKNGDTIPISQPYRKSVRKQLAERVWRDRE